MNASHETAAPHLISEKLVSVTDDGVPHLLGGRCANCGALGFPRADVCTKCLSEKIETVRLAGEGKLYSYSVVHQAPKGWNVPYALGYVDLTDGVRVLAHLDAPASALAIDRTMTLSHGVVGTDAHGVPLSTYTFVPA